MCAANEALLDAKWQADSPAAKAATGVAIGAGMSSTADMAEAGILVAQVGVEPFVTAMKHMQHSTASNCHITS